ncbi:MAG TPA: hypothetical protein VF064_11955, partial [Pyrinomonadaceae bacterium]
MNRDTRNAAQLCLLAAVLCLLTPAGLRASEPIQLEGTWRFALDRADAGVKEAWFGRSLPDRISLPGILQSQGYGDEISTQTPWVLSLYDRHWFLREEYEAYTRAGNVKVAFLPQPPRHYVGVAWYQRDVNIPDEWRGRRVLLFSTFEPQRMQFARTVTARHLRLTALSGFG